MLEVCFGYCAVFPKGHRIVKDDLINQWISLGFIEPSNRYSHRQLGETYVTHLLRMSFLQYAESQSVSYPLLLFYMHTCTTEEVNYDLLNLL